MTNVQPLTVALAASPAAVEATEAADAMPPAFPLSDGVVDELLEHAVKLSRQSPVPVATSGMNRRIDRVVTVMIRSGSRNGCVMRTKSTGLIRVRSRNPAHPAGARLLGP